MARVVSERFEQGRNFANKLWNAARFALLNLENYSAGPVELDELAQVDVGQRVARQHDESVVQQSLGVLYAPGGPERLLLGHVRERDAQVGAVPEVISDHARQELHRGHDLGDAVAPGQGEDVLHHRLADDGQHRLGLVARERAKPGTLSPRHDHGLHGWLIIPTAPGATVGRRRHIGPRRRSRR